MLQELSWSDWPKKNSNNMPELTTVALAVTIILAQLGICMAGSRCTHIKTPCFELDRQIMDPKEKPDELVPAGSNK
jgi:hypothetical protein